MRRLRYGAIFFLGLAATLLLLWRVYPGAGKANPRTLVPQRTLEARLTGFRKESPSRARTERLTRSGNAEAGEKTTNPESLHARGLEHLLYGDVEKAVGDLERAAELSPRDAPLRSDLAAAYLVRAEEKQRPDDLIRGLSAALEANRLDPALPEAAFNRALLSEKLFIRQQAIQAWKAYLELDRGSQWAAQAERHLQALERPTLMEIWPAQRKKLTVAAIAGDGATVREIVRGAPQASREYVEEELLGAWADAQAKGDLAAASRDLKAAEVIGGAVFEVTGDAMARDSVAVVREAMSSTDPSRLGRLAEGHRYFQQGKDLYEALDMKASMEPLVKARDLLKGAGSPFLEWADLYYEVGVFRQGDLEEALAEFDRLGADTKYPVLQARGVWMGGLVRYYQGRFGASLDQYKRALNITKQAHQAQDTANLQLLIADELTLLGESLESRRYLQLALGLSGYVLKRRWVVTLLEDAAWTASLLGKPSASFQFLDEAVDTALQDHKPPVLCDALLARARAHHEQADDAGSLVDIEAAESWLTRIQDAPIHLLMEAQFLEARGDAESVSDPDRVVADLGIALRDRAQSGAGTATTRLYSKRGRAYLKMGRFDRAEADFLAGIQEFESHRASVPEEQVRISYFDQSRDVFDDMIALQATVRRNPEQALEFSERSRARELLDMATRRERARPAVYLDTMGRRLPENLEILYYSVLQDQVLVFIISNKGTLTSRLKVRTSDLERDSEDLLGAMKSDKDVFGTYASRLYDVLIRPLEDSLTPFKSLVIVPDKFLHRLPFAALLNKESGRFLIEDHALAISPSLSLLAHDPDLNTLFNGHLGVSALVVGNPELDRDRISDLPSLPGSESEAKQIAAIYSESEVLIGKNATKRKFLDAIGQYAIVHFGGHSVSNEEFPLLSQLLLAPDSAAGDDGALMAHELYAREFTKTQLVVLAACSTAKARVSPGEGALNLARPFLASGVPSVVASLWEVDDASSTAFFRAFHDLVHGGLAPFEALRKTQTSFLTGSNKPLNSPSVWAAYEVIQGSRRSP